MPNNSVESAQENKKIPIKGDIESLIPDIQREINKRRKKWTLTSIDFEDVSQKTIIRVIENYDSFNPEKGEFLHWVNKVISNSIWNILRDNYLKYSRPCILGCIHNTGDDNCSMTDSGKQCAECPLYRDWERQKKEQFNINQPLSLDNHVQELNDEFYDIEYAKNRLNIEMQKRLDENEWKFYQLIFIDKKHGDIKADTIKSYGISYPAYNKLYKKFISLAKQIIEEESLA